MKELSASACTTWCSSRRIQLAGAYQRPRFGDTPYAFSIALPENGRGRASLSVALFHDADDHPIPFHGGLCWFHRWDIGSQDTEDIGMAMTRSVRTSFGVAASMAEAPGIVFERSELMNLRALFLLALIFEWDASFVDAHGDLIIAASHDSILYVVCRSEAEKNRLVSYYAPYWDVVDNAAPRYLTGN